MNAFMSLALALTLAGGAPAQAPTPPPPPWGLGVESAVPIRLPLDARRVVELELEYGPDDTLKGVVVDLDDDGVDDYIVQAARSLCGTGGCHYVIVNGATGRLVGRTFGNPLYIRADRRHGYPVIESYAHLHAGAGAFTTYAFDGSEYRVTSQRELVGAAGDTLFAGWRDVPVWRPAVTEGGWAGSPFYRVPGEFSAAPTGVVAALEQRGCRVPQVRWVPEPNNVISGHFASPTSTDWAALCSRRGESVLLVFFGPDWRRIDSLVGWRVADAAGRGIFVAPRGRVAERARSVRPGTDTAVIQDGVEDGSGNSSEIHHYSPAGWIRYPGAVPSGGVRRPP